MRRLGHLVVGLAAVALLSWIVVFVVVGNHAASNLPAPPARPSALVRADFADARGDTLPTQTAPVGAVVVVSVSDNLSRPSVASGSLTLTRNSEPCPSEQRCYQYVTTVAGKVVVDVKPDCSVMTCSGAGYIASYSFTLIVTP